MAIPKSFAPIEVHRAAVEYAALLNAYRDAAVALAEAVPACRGQGGEEVSLSFSHDKARAIVALPMGAELETRRKMKLAGNHADWEHEAASDFNWASGGAWMVQPNGDGRQFCKPRYRPGRVYPLCFPHRRMAGRFLPTWAATHWVLVLSAGPPQRVQDITEQQAVDELVEYWDRPIDGVPARQWRDYRERGRCFGLLAARDSFFTLLDKVNGPGTAARNEWVWPYRLRLVPKPAPGKIEEMPE